MPCTSALSHLPLDDYVCCYRLPDSTGFAEEHLRVIASVVYHCQWLVSVPPRLSAFYT